MSIIEKLNSVKDTIIFNGKVKYLLNYKIINKNNIIINFPFFHSFSSLKFI